MFLIRITQDVDEALYKSDPRRMLTSDPNAKIVEILEVPFVHPRDRQELRELKECFSRRNHALNFLVGHFTQDE
jgi:nitrate/nitrite transport system ATP-binding protein